MAKDEINETSNKKLVSYMDKVRVNGLVAKRAKGYRKAAEKLSGLKKDVKEEVINEANYHSVFFKNDGVWCHHFDADNKEDATSEKESIRNQGHRTISIVTPKGDRAHNWGTDKSKGQTDPHEFVTNHLKSKGLREHWGEFGPASKDQHARAVREHPHVVGNYVHSDHPGDKFELRRASGDGDRHVMINKTKKDIVDGFAGPTHEVHGYVTNLWGFKGSLKEEAIHELSKGLLQRYAKSTEGELRIKADRTWNNYPSSKTTSWKAKKRYAGADAAAAKLGRPNFPKPKVMATEETQPIDEVSNKTLKSYMSKAGDEIHSIATRKRAGYNLPKEINSKLFNRLNGYEKAKSKLKNEEIERIDEVSKKYLGKYHAAAVDDLDAQSFSHGVSVQPNPSKDQRAHLDDNERRIAQRKKYIKKAFKKVSEDVENIHEIGDTEKGRKALSSYMTKRKSGNQAMGYGYNPADHPNADARTHEKAFKKTQGILRAKDRIDDNTPLQHKPKIHDVSHMSDGEVYDHTQTSSKIKDGDVLHMKGGRSAIMFKAWPTMVHGDSEALHSFGSRGAPKSHAASIKVAKNIGGIVGAKEKNVKEEAIVEDQDGVTLAKTKAKDAISKMVSHDAHGVSYWNDGWKKSPITKSKTTGKAANGKYKLRVAEEVEDVEEGRTYRADRDSYYASRKRDGAASALKKSSKASRLARDQKKRAIGEDTRVEADGTTDETVVKEPTYRKALKASTDQLRHNYLVKKQIYRTDD